MKKGFTLSETLVSLVVIGIIAAVLIPVLNNVRPDKDRLLYKKALYTMQNAIATAINDNTINASNTSAFWAGDEVQPQDFCNNIADTMNVVGAVNCGNIGSSTTPNFTTSNGSKWWGLGGSDPADKFTLTGAKSTKVITVDVNGNSGENQDNVDQLKLKVRYDGRVTTDTSWTKENEYLSDSLKINK